MATSRQQTRTEKEMEDRLLRLKPGSERYEVLASARRFKAAWVEFADKLTAVREAGEWREWGYASFEVYARRELHLKRDTVNKLTRSFAFLRDHAAIELADRETRELPPLEVVDLLSRAKERTTVTPKQLEKIQRDVFDMGGASPTRGDVLKRFREIDPQAFRATPQAAGGEADVRKALLLAERLGALLGEMAAVSSLAQGGVKQAITELRGIFEQTRKKRVA